MTFLAAGMIDGFAAVPASAQTISYAPGARILHVGYPRLFEPQNMAALGFTPTQIKGVKLLNGTLAYSALSSRVAFVPVACRFAGHAVPSADHWLNYPPRFGYNNFAFHPNAAGYASGYAASIRPFL